LEGGGQVSPGETKQSPQKVPQGYKGLPAKPQKTDVLMGQQKANGFAGEKKGEKKKKEKKKKKKKKKQYGEQEMLARGTTASKGLPGKAGRAKPLSGWHPPQQSMTITDPFAMEEKEGICCAIEPLAWGRKRFLI